MIIDSKFNVPYIYRNSRDYQAILKLLDLLLTAVKEGIDDLLQIFDPEICPESLLPLLASYVGYDYDYKETVKANRTIIANYQSIIHNRGSVTGISLATALAFNASDKTNDIEAMSFFDISYDREDNRIIIYVYYPNYIQKMRELIERARPAGVKLSIVPAYDMRTVDKIEFHDYIDPKRMPYDKTRYDVGDTKVGFSEITNKKEPKSDPEFPHYDNDNN